MGRPKVPKEKQKIPFPIRFTRENVASFEAAAKRANVDVREWVTSTLTEAVKRT